MKNFVFILILLAPKLSLHSQAILSLKDIGSGIDRTVTIESSGQFRIVFEAATNWGIAQWYDLVNDPDANTNLTYCYSDEPIAAEPGLFQMVWYGTQPNDPKLYMYAAKYKWPDVERSFTIQEETPQRIIVEAISHPLLIAGVLDNLTVAVQYYIYPDGKLYIRTKMTSTEPQAATEWRNALLGLSDPTTDTDKDDVRGWIRSTTTQSPYDWTPQMDPYIYAFWSKNTPAPYSEWTKASVMLVSAPGNTNIDKHARHNLALRQYKRWYYFKNNLDMAAGKTITQNFLIQLGAENSTVLPNIINSTVADPIANEYILNPPDFVLSENPVNASNTEGFILSQNYPNPLSTTTEIKYTIPFQGISLTKTVQLKIIDLMGREVNTLVNDFKSAGVYMVKWDGTNSFGQKVDSGVYFYKLSIGNEYYETKMMILK